MNDSGSDLEDDDEASELCEEGVDQIDFGKNRLIGCWGNDGICKIKCK